MDFGRGQLIYCSRQDFDEFCDGKAPFDVVPGIQGEIYRHKEGRKTMRFEFQGQGYFIKVHSGIGWKEIFKNLLQIKLPVLGASNEWYAIQSLERLNIGTLTPVAFGKKGLNPAKQFSFVVTEELTDTISLAKYVELWKDNPPSFKFKRALIRHIAGIAKAIHDEGLSHKDFYLCHFLLQRSLVDNPVLDLTGKIYVVDLHRMEQRKFNAIRWIVKDIGALYFSTMDLQLTRRDYFYFMKLYSGLPLSETLTSQGQFWRKVEKKARRLYRRDWGKDAQDVMTKPLVL